jgi:hypothetical protein
MGLCREWHARSAAILRERSLSTIGSDGAVSSLGKARVAANGIEQRVSERMKIFRREF